MNIIINNLNICDDINLAHKIINGKLNIPKDFSYISPIYKTTNENISKEAYSNSLYNKRRVLSIIGSGDQILNAILFGTKEIVGIDVSTFPKYFLLLKFAAINNLSKEEYIKYFYNSFFDSFDVTYYNKIRCSLEKNTKIFWDSIYNNYETDSIYNSNLFYPFDLSIDRAKSFNPYLQYNNYNVLKKKINSINIELFNHDMFNINELDIGKFDLAILSNLINNINKNKSKKIFNLHNAVIENITLYKIFLNSLPLNKKGIAISYNFGFDGEIKKYFKEKEYEVYQVDADLKICTLKNEILIFDKNKSLQLSKKK